jgi:hypothetical protein
MKSPDPTPPGTFISLVNAGDMLANSPYGQTIAKRAGENGPAMLPMLVLTVLEIACREGMPLWGRRKDNAQLEKIPAIDLKNGGFDLLGEDGGALRQREAPLFSLRDNVWVGVRFALTDIKELGAGPVATTVPKMPLAQAELRQWISKHACGRGTMPEHWQTACAAYPDRRTSRNAYYSVFPARKEIGRHRKSRI